jgi:hypothetical protein
MNVPCADGLWNYIEADEVAAVISDCLIAHHQYAAGQQQQQTRHRHRHSDSDSDSDSDSSSCGPPPPTPAQCLLAKCQQNAASAAGLPYDLLLSLPSGPEKRMVLDDITIIVMFAPPPPSR